MEDREGPKKAAAVQDGSAASLTSQEFTEEACLGCSEKRRSLRPPTSIFKVYIERLTGLRGARHPDGLSTTLLAHACVLKATPAVGVEGRMWDPRTGEGWGTSPCPGPVGGSTRSHILSITSSNSEKETNRKSQLTASGGAESFNYLKNVWPFLITSRYHMMQQFNS